MVEIATNIGGIDLMTEHRDVIVELKLDQEADIPLTQTEKTRDQEQFFHPKKKRHFSFKSISIQSLGISTIGKESYYSRSEKIKDIFT